MGDRVASTGVIGAYAEYALVPADRLVRLPDGITTRQAAAVLLQGMTAQYLTSSTYPLMPGDSCLVHAAAGGTGLLLCQLARKRGAHVIGTVSTDEKAVLALAAGAADVIIYTREDFVARTRSLTRGAGVQVVYDSVGRTTCLPGFDCLAMRGMMVLFGQSSGTVDPIEPRMLQQKGSLFLTRPTLNHYIAADAELQARATDVLAWVADGTLTVRIGEEFPLAAAGRRASRARGPAHDRKGAAPSLDAADHTSPRPPPRRAHLGRQLHRHQAGVHRHLTSCFHGGAVRARLRAHVARPGAEGRVADAAAIHLAAARRTRSGRQHDLSALLHDRAVPHHRDQQFADPGQHADRRYCRRRGCWGSSRSPRGRSGHWPSQRLACCSSSRRAASPSTATGSVTSSCSPPSCAGPAIPWACGLSPGA